MKCSVHTRLTRPKRCGLPAQFRSSWTFLTCRRWEDAVSHARGGSTIASGPKASRTSSKRLSTAAIGTLVQESFALTYPDRGRPLDRRAERLIEPADLQQDRSRRREIARPIFSAAVARGVVLRFAAFYGPDAMQVRSYISGLRRGWAALPGGPDRYISSISHDDAAAAVVAALERAGRRLQRWATTNRVRSRGLFPIARRETSAWSRHGSFRAGRPPCSDRWGSDGPLASPVQQQANERDGLGTAVSECPRRMGGDAGTDDQSLSGGRL